MSWVGVGADLGLDEGLEFSAPIRIFISEFLGCVGDAEFVGELLDCVAQLAFGFVESGVWSGPARIKPSLALDLLVKRGLEVAGVDHWSENGLD